MKVAKFRGRGYVVFDDVYDPSDDSFMLAEAIERIVPSTIGLSLDVGCGCGILTLFLAEKSKLVVAVDVNPSATKNTAINAHRSGLKHKVQVVAGDLLAPFRFKPIFDLVVFNPPYLPEDEHDLLVPDRLRIAWSGGRGGRRVIDAFLSTFHRVVKPGGLLLLVQSSLSNCSLTIRKLRELGFEVEVVSCRRFFYESLYLVKAVRVV